MEKKADGTMENSIVKSSQVRVKSFDEIMEEKRKRAQVQVQDEGGKTFLNSTGGKTASIQGRETAKPATSGVYWNGFWKI